MSSRRFAIASLVLAVAVACRSHADFDGAEEPLVAGGVALAPAPASIACPAGMMAVAGRFCIDRWEVSLVDKSTGTALSPYYPPDRRLAVAIAEEWEARRVVLGSVDARQMPLPPLPSWEAEHDVEPLARSLPGVVPSGYLSARMAARACGNADKRLCRHDEWLLACRGEASRMFPYGRVYRQGACNTFRALHPAIVLHDSVVLGHNDPRLNLVKEKNGDPLLRPTGATPECKSEWAGDVAWDMVGNLDEWVDDPHGRLMGSFYSRSKTTGCDSSVTEHPPEYFDYSTGARCCASPRSATGERR